MAENRFSKGVKAAKERTAELEANKKKQEQEVDQTKIEELPEEQKSTFQKSFLTHQRKRNQLQKLFI